MRTPPDQLTPREREVLELYARHGSQKAVAHELGLRTGTVRAHLARARLRTGHQTTVQLVAHELHREGGA